MVPDFLSHYYEASVGPFVNLSDLPLAEAEQHMARIRQEGQIFASKRSDDYLAIRRDLEERVRNLFIQKGGKPVRQRPHYMVVGSCPWLLEWYIDGRELRIPLADFSPDTVSITYGDTFPAMRYDDGKPYRKQVYTLDELPGLIEQFGLPQEWNRDGKHGPDRYIEAQIWDDAPLRNFCKNTRNTY
jgi:hypothetical protein